MNYKVAVPKPITNETVTWDLFLPVLLSTYGPVSESAWPLPLRRQASD
jgi:hypothetical protein